MDLAELIRVPRVDGVLWKGNPDFVGVDMTMEFTTHHIFVRQMNNQKELLRILNRNIDSTDHKGPVLILRTKNLRTLLFDFKGKIEDVINVADSLEKIAAIDDVSRSFPFVYQPNFQILEDGWTTFQPQVEFTKLILSPDSEWRITCINRDYKVCSSYPSSVIVPSAISDDQLISSAYFRQGGRFPVLSYKHRNGQVIVRTSQPLMGPNSKRCRNDEKILAAIINRQRKGYIIDTRTQSTSHSAKAKGGGYETEQYYPRWKRINKSIDRYHFLLDSYSKFVDACHDQSGSCERWLSKLAVSSWLTHVKEILTCGCLIAQMVEKEEVPVVVHGSEGLDITLCVTSLAQVILNPDCRTVRGFEALVELEWVQAGHPFWSRTTKGPLNDSIPTKSKNHSPTFIMFLDCVWQIYRQFPCSFEFTEAFLVMLADEAYASDFGTFICDNERERMLREVKSRTVSLWSYINRPEVLSEFLNCLYEPNKSVIWPSVAPVSLAIWNSMYFRWITDPSPRKETDVKAVEIMERHKKAKHEVIKLRKQLQYLIQEAEKLGLLTDKTDSFETEVKTSADGMATDDDEQGSLTEDYIPEWKQKS